jgi:4-hydroxy-tetrahydrodipicolinate synthase
VQPIDGLILAATTGEGLTLDDEELDRLVDVVAEAVDDGLPLYLGLSGSDTRKLMKSLGRTRRWPVSGYLVACPYYTRPSQEGLFRHFAALALEAEKPILVYNIPYRTGVNLSNETLLRLADLRQIVGVKDCCADAQQSFDLLRARPPGFSVLTGEDALFYAALTQGADGGILASAHVETQAFARVRDALLAGQREAALREWSHLVDIVHLLFAEPSPAPVKHWLWRLGLIDSPEVRLPMTEVSAALATRLDEEVGRRIGAAIAA